MKFVPLSRKNMHPYSELIAVVQESASDLVEHQMTRDRERFAYEKQKLVLLVTLILSLWIMFFLLWGKLDDLCPAKSVPPGENHTSPSVPDLVTPDREPSSIHYVI